MATKVPIGLDRDDRHFPFFLGQLDAPSDFELVALAVGMVLPRRQGIDRHRHMLSDKEILAGPH